MTPTTKRARSPKPHQRLAKPLPPLVQPPAHLAHLAGEELYQALVTDPETWTTDRVALESGRAKHTVSVWVSNYYLAADGNRLWDDVTFIKPTPVGATPTWKAGEVRAWLMRTGKMDRRGVFRPFKPAGRPKGIRESGRPRRGSEMEKEAPVVLRRYNELLHDRTPREARQQVRSEFGLSEPQVHRRLQRGRELAPADKPPARDSETPED